MSARIQGVIPPEEDALLYAGTSYPMNVVVGKPGKAFALSRIHAQPLNVIVVWDDVNSDIMTE